MTDPAWSYSQLKAFETCEKRYYHYNVAKDVVEPQTEQLLEGTNLHAHFAARIAKGVPLPLGYGMYEGILSRIAAAPGVKAVEQKLAITSSFAPCAYFARDVWFRTVIDCAVITGDRAALFDWKNGKPNDDETQLALMAATLFIHQPAIQRVKSALVFVGHGQTYPLEYAREDQKEIWNDILPRVRKMMAARVSGNYPPKPSGLCRRYCAVKQCPHCGK